MKKITLFIITLFILTSCTKKPGSFSGNVFWKYNDFVGNKPDSGSEIKIYSTENKELVTETTTDVMGNFKFDEIPPGTYFVIIKSKNTTDSPIDHLNNITIMSEKLNYLFGYNIYKSNKKEIDVIKKLENQYLDVLTGDEKLYGGRSKQIEKYSSIELDIKNKTLDLISKFPFEFRSKLGLFTGYDNSLKFSTVEINEGKNTTENIDFGTTYN